MSAHWTCPWTWASWHHSPGFDILAGRPFERCLRTFGWFGWHQQEICISAASVGSNVIVAAAQANLTNSLWQAIVLRNVVPIVVSFRRSRGWNSCSALAGIVGHSDALDSRLWPILLIEHKNHKFGWISPMIIFLWLWIQRLIYSIHYMKSSWYIIT